MQIEEIQRELNKYKYGLNGRIFRRLHSDSVGIFALEWNNPSRCETRKSSI